MVPYCLHRQVRAYLDTPFLHAWTDRSRPIAWLPCSPHLKAADFDEVQIRMATAVAMNNADSDVLEELLYRWDTFHNDGGTTQNNRETGKYAGEKSLFLTTTMHFVSYL
jgi:hypothetical protein